MAIYSSMVSQISTFNTSIAIPDDDTDHKNVFNLT